MYYKLVFALLSCAFLNSCGAQKKDSIMLKTNPLLCDPAEGFCAMPDSNQHAAKTIVNKEKNIKVIYFTDPICSSCWGIEPQLRKLKLEYGNSINIEYRMGGLLPDWSYNSGGISKPSDVAHHWDEVSLYYDMPIDGDVWLEDPLPSSYPPSIAFKAATIQDPEKAIVFLRALRELVFLQKKNITKWEYIAAAAKTAGLNTEQLKNDFDGKAKTLFEEDLKLAGELGVRGFPTLFFIDQAGKKEIVYGSKPYSQYEAAIIKLAPGTTKEVFPKDWQTLFSNYASLTAKEFSVLSGIPRTEAEIQLNELSGKGILRKASTKNGSIWYKP